MPKNRIKEIRKAKGMTLEGIARQLGTSHMLVQRLELGKQRLTTEWTEKIAGALGCDPSELVGWKTRTDWDVQNALIEELIAQSETAALEMLQLSAKLRTSVEMVKRMKAKT